MKKKHAWRDVSIINLLPTHAISPTHRKWLECLLVIAIETFLVPLIGFRQESFRMKNSRLHPIDGIVLNVLQIYTDDVLKAGQRTVVFSNGGLKVCARKRMH